MSPYYSTEVLRHFRRPLGVGELDTSDPAVGTGLGGSLGEGRVLRFQIRVSIGDVIEQARFNAYGCPSTIACGSLVSSCVKGKTLPEAMAINDHWIAARLALAPEKLPCAVLAVNVLRTAISDFQGGG